MILNHFIKEVILTLSLQLMVWNELEIIQESIISPFILQVPNVVVTAFPLALHHRSHQSHDSVICLHVYNKTAGIIFPFVVIGIISNNSGICLGLYCLLNCLLFIIILSLCYNQWNMKSHHSDPVGTCDIITTMSLLR